MRGRAPRFRDGDVLMVEGRQGRPAVVTAQHASQLPPTQRAPLHLPTGLAGELRDPIANCSRVRPACHGLRVRDAGDCGHHPGTRDSGQNHLGKDGERVKRSGAGGEEKGPGGGAAAAVRTVAAVIGMCVGPRKRAHTHVSQFEAGSIPGIPTGSQRQYPSLRPKCVC